MGIATKNSNPADEYAIMARATWYDSNDALLDACHNARRPIVMTTTRLGAGMMPNRLGIAPTRAFARRLAIVVIGGLITSTFLSLLVIPVLFTYVDDVVQWTRRCSAIGRTTRRRKRRRTHPLAE